MKQNGIAHLRITPYHPASNDLAKQAVQTLKASMKQMQEESKVSCFLFKYRVTPHTVQLRCNFTLAREQFTRTLEQFTQARIELLLASVLLPVRNSCKIIR